MMLTIADHSSVCVLHQQRYKPRRTHFSGVIMHFMHAHTPSHTHTHTHTHTHPHTHTHTHTHTHPCVHTGTHKHSLSTTKFRPLCLVILCSHKTEGNFLKEEKENSN